MKFILALDQGTTSSRAILFDSAGQPIASAQREFTQHFPHNGWVEHDPEEIWTSQRDAALQALDNGKIQPSDIAAIGITNQRETTIVWDRDTGQPVCPAIVWQDRRTAPFCDRLKRGGHGPLIQQKTGLVIDAYFSATKLRWILDNVPGVRPRAAAGQLAFGTIDSWLIFKLTGGRVHATDPSNASRTMLLNINTLQWDDDLLRLFDIPRGMLPEIRPSSGHFGETSLFGPPVPIMGVAGDQQAALFGQTCFTRGTAKNTYGTGCFMLMNAGPAAPVSQHQLLSTVAWQLATGGAATYALEGSVFIGGAVVQWLRDGLGIIPSAADVERLANTVPDSGGVYLVPAFAGLGAPHWDPYARGAVLGITRGTTAAHLARAALESIAFQVADILAIMQEDSRTPIRELRVDGGAAANNLLLQFQADLLGVPVIRPMNTETTALGAAYIAGLATGFFPSQSALQANAQVDRTFLPKLSAAQAQHRQSRWRTALQRARDWEEHG